MPFTKGRTLLLGLQNKFDGLYDVSIVKREATPRKLELNNTSNPFNDM